MNAIQFKCPECDKTFASVYGRSAHLGNNHRGYGGSTGRKQNVIDSGKEKGRLTRLRYEANPVCCPQCNNSLPYERRKLRFCNSSCAATFNNSRKIPYRIPKNSSYTAYKLACRFLIDKSLYPKIPNYHLYLEKGMYCSRRNTEGVVRDHIFSTLIGFQQGIDPVIISHPANCQFLSHRDNAVKGKLCHITLEELMTRIEKWREDA